MPSEFDKIEPAFVQTHGAWVAGADGEARLTVNQVLRVRKFDSFAAHRSPPLGVVNPVVCRLDVALVEAGLVRSRHQGQQWIADGRVSVGGKVATKPSQMVASGVSIATQSEPWVSRAAHKLLGALDDAGVVVPTRCLDAGASTGGFTQVLLSRGARRVYAVDVGHGQLAPELAEDARVTQSEGCNVKDLSLDDLDGRPVGLAVADLSFISLTAVLPSLLPLVDRDGDVLLLVKPQFEVGKQALGPSGVVRDDALRQAAVDRVCSAAADLGWTAVWRGVSRLPGAHGNIEYFVHLRTMVASG